ncbi:hypothetical protein M0R45_035626 [Rubus argutus]|uniref:Uncharacterized protein n=1 Tax=Rubus argutus TaxID=59490 RepID=A0AAW1VY09_RUBAR
MPRTERCGKRRSWREELGSADLQVRRQWAEIDDGVGFTALGSETSTGSFGSTTENGLGAEVTRAQAQVQRNGSPAVLLNWKVMRADCEFGAWGFVGGGAAATIAAMNWTESKSGCD